MYNKDYTHNDNNLRSKRQLKPKYANVTDLGMTNKVNLCNNCKHEFATCNAQQIIFGTGFGNDNVASCDTHSPLVMNDWVKQSTSTSENLTK